jgi:hypothetical protein
MWKMGFFTHPKFSFKMSHLHIFAITYFLGGFRQRNFVETKETSLGTSGQNFRLLFTILLDI